MMLTDPFADLYAYVRTLVDNATIRFRRGSTSQWEATNRVLLDGEPGWDSTTKNLFVGDGVTPFLELQPITGGGGGGGGEGGSTNLTTQRSATTVTIASDTGTDAVIPAADTSAGVMSATQKTKLDGVAAGATANLSDSTLLNRSSHTGSQPISTVTGLQTALDSKGTSNLALGTTGSTALRGNATAADIGGLVGSGITAIVVLSQTAYDNLPSTDPTTLYVIS